MAETADEVRSSVRGLVKFGLGGVVGVVVMIVLRVHRNRDPEPASPTGPGSG